MGLGSWIGDWHWGFGIGILDKDWGLVIGIRDRRLELDIGIGDWRLGFGIGYWRLRLGIGRMTNDNNYTLHFVLMRMKFILFLHFMLDLLLCFFEGCVVPG